MSYSRLIVPAILLILTGCAARNLMLLDSAFQPQLVNQTDTFSFQASNLPGLTQTINWTWQNTGTSADLNHSSSITGGTATLTVLDADGIQLYSQPLQPSGTPNIGSGAAGGWTVRLTLTNVSGMINFSLQKP